MCKVQKLRQRLNAAVEEIFGLFERTIAEYEQELSRAKVENERQRELLDHVFNPHAGLRKADVQKVSVENQEEFPIEQQEWSSNVRQEEPEPPNIKKEKDEHMTPEADGGHFEENTHSEPDSIFAPLSDMDDMSDCSETSHSDDTKESLKSNKDSKGLQLVSVESQEEVPSEQQEWSSSVKQEKPEPSHIKAKEDEPHIMTEADGEDFEDTTQSEPDRLFAPLSDTDDMSDSSETNHSDDTEKPRESSKDSKDVQQVSVESQDEVPSEQQELIPSVRQEELESPSSKDQEDGQHLRTEADGEHFEENMQSEPNSLFAPLSDTDGMSDFSDVDHTNDAREPSESRRHSKDDMIHFPNKNIFDCSECGKSYIQKASLKRHMVSHTGEKHFTCSVCAKRFSLKEYLNKHMVIHTKKSLPCSVCARKFRGKYDLKIHMRTHTREKPFPCPVCKKCFTSRAYLIVHMRMHTSEKPFTCSSCMSSFSNQTALVIHMRKHAAGKSLASSSSAQHITEDDGEHRGGSQADSILAPQFDMNDSMSHSTETNLREGAKEPLKGMKDATDDLKQHTKRKRFDCSQCGKTYGQRGRLTVHMKTHSSKKPFACSLCTKSYTQKLQLRKHMRTHTEERPFACSVCGKRFLLKHHMTRHMSIHTREKPFSCLF